MNLKVLLLKEKTNSLVLENPKLYRDLVVDLKRSIDDDSDELVFSENDVIIKKSKCLMVAESLFCLDFENKKFQKVIIDRLFEIAMDERHYEKTQTILSKIEAYLYELEWEETFNLSISMDNFYNILKCGIAGIEKPDGILEQFVEYIKIVARILKCKVLICVGFQECFTLEEWKQVECVARHEELYLFCIERSVHLIDDNKIIIDTDNCRVV